jgi:hypothetical protein
MELLVAASFVAVIAPSSVAESGGVGSGLFASPHATLKPLHKDATRRIEC